MKNQGLLIDIFSVLIHELPLANIKTRLSLKNLKIMNFKKLTFALSVSLFIFSCIDSTKVDKEKVFNEVVTGNTEILPGSPCELISVDDVKSICNVSNEVEIVQEDKVYTHPTCTFEWKDGKVTHVMSVGGRDMTIDLPSEVMIVMVSNSNEKMFGQSTSVYKDGVSVDEVGEKAMWGIKMSQLTFLSNGYMFHVHIKVSDDNEDNKQKAIEVAHLLSSKI